MQKCINRFVFLHNFLYVIDVFLIYFLKCIKLSSFSKILCPLNRIIIFLISRYRTQSSSTNKSTRFNSSLILRSYLTCYAYLILQQKGKLLILFITFLISVIDIPNIIITLKYILNGFYYS